MPRLSSAGPTQLPGAAAHMSGAKPRCGAACPSVRFPSNLRNLRNLRMSFVPPCCRRSAHRRNKKGPARAQRARPRMRTPTPQSSASSIAQIAAKSSPRRKKNGCRGWRRAASRDLRQRHSNNTRRASSAAITRRPATSRGPRATSYGTATTATTHAEQARRLTLRPYVPSHCLSTAPRKKGMQLRVPLAACPPVFIDKALADKPPVAPSHFHPRLVGAGTQCLSHCRTCEDTCFVPAARQ